MRLQLGCLGKCLCSLRPPLQAAAHMPRRVIVETFYITRSLPLYLSPHRVRPRGGVGHHRARPPASAMFRRKSDESVTFHVHALQTHKAVVITGKWLAKPISQAMIGSFLDQVRAPGPIGQHATQVPMGDVSSLEAVPAVCHSNL